MPDDEPLISAMSTQALLDPTSHVLPGARIVGAVTLGAQASVWYNAVLRADGDGITVGPGSNIQDNASIHDDIGFPVVIGANVSVGHNAVVHACTVGDDSLIGMGSVVLTGAVIGRQCLIAAGAVVTEGARIPGGSLASGVPARVRRELTEDEKTAIVENAHNYVRKFA